MQKIPFYRQFTLKTMLLVGILVVLTGIYVGDLLIQRQKEIVIQIFVANDDQNVLDAEKMEKSLAEMFGIAKNQRIVVDDSLYVVFNNADRYIESSLSKIYAYIAAKELDVLIAPKDVVEHYANGLEMTDLASLIKNTTALSKEISQSLVQTVGPDGEKKAYLLDLKDSRYASSNASYLIIPQNAPHKEAIIRFLNYLYTD